MTKPLATSGNPLALKMTERQLQDAVVDLAHTFGWLVMHSRPAQTSRGWRTPIQGDKGFPDLVMAKSGHVIFAELKSEKGLLTVEQEHWRIELICGKWMLEGEAKELLRYCFWRPADWLSGEIEGVLRGS